jgi:hypothetical protein
MRRLKAGSEVRRLSSYTYKHPLGPATEMIMHCLVKVVCPTRVHLATFEWVLLHSLPCIPLSVAVLIYLIVPIITQFRVSHPTMPPSVQE